MLLQNIELEILLTLPSLNLRPTLVPAQTAGRRVEVLRLVLDSVELSDPRHCFVGFARTGLLSLDASLLACTRQPTSTIASFAWWKSLW